MTRSRKSYLAAFILAELGVIVGELFFAIPPAGHSVHHKTISPTPAPTAVAKSTPTPIPAPIPLNNYGFSANELVWKSAKLRAAQLAGMKAVGVSRVRIDIQWYVVQPFNADTYDWSVYDQAIDAIHQQGFSTLAILDYAPEWAAAPGCRSNINRKCAPVNLPAFATFAAAAAARYSSRGVTSWEIWNESNTPKFWYPKVDATIYANLLRLTYPAIKRVDPAATIITGGLTSTSAPGSISPPDYIAALYAAGGQPYFDALGVHPYSYPALPSSSSRMTGWTQMLRIRDIAVAHGDATKKIWITEVGATTGGPHPVRESLQAQIAEEAVRLRNSYNWSGPLFWYDYQDLGTGGSGGENFMGLVRANGSQKPAYASFVGAIK